MLLWLRRMFRRKSRPALSAEEVDRMYTDYVFYG
jgi:hypothetical protein